jgi:hypothetical protein
MINDSENNANKNNNYIKEYIENNFKKEKKKFTRLKYKLNTLNRKKTSQNITLFYTIESNYNNENLPYINKNQIKSEKKYNINSNKILNLIRSSQKYEENINSDERCVQNTKIFKNILSGHNHNENNEDNEMNEIQISNYDINSLSNSKRDYLTINTNDTNEINSYRMKINNLKDAIGPKKSSKKILKNIKKILDKEIINSNNITKNRRRSNAFNKGSEEIKKRLRIIKNEIKAKKEKEEAKIIDTLYIGNNIINNCKMKEKIIYDIRPLNKTKEKASCHFS